MPFSKTSFKDDWLKKKDSNDQILEEWCEKRPSKYEVFCRFCKKIIRCDNRGLSQLITHSESQCHASLVKSIVNGRQMTFMKQQNAGSSSQRSSACWSTTDNIIKAEILWALKAISNNFSYSSADDINDLFRTMFPDSSIASQFTMSHTKLSYLITEAIGPHFHELLLYDVRNSKSPFTISFDELTNKQIKKQLDLKIKYWSNQKNEVVIHHLDSFLMGQAKGKDIAEKIMQSLNSYNLPLKDLITLGSDGPNVNKTVFQIISQIKISQDLPTLLDVGTCTLHAVHGAFGKAVGEYGAEVVDLIIDLHNFFKLSPVRMEELKNLQDELGFKNLKFLKHVESRWLTLGPALERLNSQWTVISDYFIKTLPKRDTKISENSRYIRILKCLRKPNAILLQLNFLLAISNILQPFLAFFQLEEPLIHLLYDRMTTLVKSLLGRFMKPENLKGKTMAELKLLNFSSLDIELNDNDIEIGVEARKILGKMKQELKKEKIVFMRKFLRSLAQKLLKKIPVDAMTKEARCLKPENRCESWSLQSFKNLASTVQLIPPIDADVVADEWRVLQCENIPKDWYYYEDEEKPIYKRIDHYYNKIFALKNDLRKEKYPEMTRLIKAVLVISHGNADVERGFSQTTHFLTDTRIHLSQASVSALQSTKDGLKQYDNKCHLVPITSDFLKKGSRARKSYMERLEKEKRIAAQLKKQKEEEKEQKKKEKEELERKREALKKRSRITKEAILAEKSLEKEEIEVNTTINTYKSLVDEANERIKNALKSNDLKGAQIGQTMLEAACKKVEESTNTLQKIRNEQKEIEKTKRTMLDYFCSNQTKKIKKT